MKINRVSGSCGKPRSRRAYYIRTPCPSTYLSIAKLDPQRGKKKEKEHSKKLGARGVLSWGHRANPRIQAARQTPRRRFQTPARFRKKQRKSRKQSVTVASEAGAAGAAAQRGELHPARGQPGCGPPHPRGCPRLPGAILSAEPGASPGHCRVWPQDKVRRKRERRQLRGVRTPRRREPARADTRPVLGGRRGRRGAFKRRPQGVSPSARV